MSEIDPAGGGMMNEIDLANGDMMSEIDLANGLGMLSAHTSFQNIP